MAIQSGSSVSSISFSSTLQPRTSQVSLPPGLFGNRRVDDGQLRNAKVRSCQFMHGKLKVKGRILRRRYDLFATSDDLSSSNSELKSDASDQDEFDPLTESFSPVNAPYLHVEGTGGKPGVISFYNHPYKREAEILASSPGRNQNNLLWFAGPAVLVAFFIFPSLYLRRILSTVFEDSLLTDFLILFFTEALFYCGVAAFLLIVDHLRRPTEQVVAANNSNPAPHLEYRITSVAVLVLSLVIPMVTMGLVWPWTGPAASATLAPYLVGIVVQFAFEQYARYVKSPSWPVIPVIFQVYRLHQLNRAAQLVTALSFTVRGAEMTSHNLAINSSLSTLLNVLQCLGVICIWSLSSFLMRFLPSATITEQ